MRSSVTASRRIFWYVFVAEVGNEAALLSAEEVACATDVEVLHGYVYARAEVGKALDGLQAPACVGRQRQSGGTMR